MNSKRLAVLFMVLSLLLCCTSAYGEVNLLQNPDFEQLDKDGMPSSWFTEAYRMMEGYTIYSVSDQAYEGEHCVTIENIGLNDARFAQNVSVKPETLYRLSGWVKADSIADSGHGANLSIADVYAFSRSFYETDGWEYVECFGWTGPEQTELTVFARVGGYSGESIGSASFDRLSLVEVDELPLGASADKWYKSAPASVSAPEVTDSDETAEPFWPWLLVLAAVFILFAVWLRPYLLDEHVLDSRDEQNAHKLLIAGLTASAVLQLIISILIEGYSVDVNCFLSWGGTMLNHGPTGFYAASGFCDYPPAYLYILALNRLIGDKLYEFAGRAWLVATYKFIPIACNIACGMLIYYTAAGNGANRRCAAALGIFTAWNAALILNSAAWCQMDSVLCLMLLVVAWLAIKGKWAWLMPVYMLAVLVKPQALMLGPLGLLAIIMAVVHKPNIWKQMVIGLAAACLVALVIIIPFSVNQPWDWIFTLYSKTLASYPYATLNTANLYYLSGGNWSSIADTANWLAPAMLAVLSVGLSAFLYKKQKGMRFSKAEPFILLVYALVLIGLGLLGGTWTAVGTVAMSMCFVIVLLIYLRCGDINKLPLLGGLLFLLLYVVGIKMHERYLMPALVLFAMAFALQRDKRILFLLTLTTATLFVNEGIVLDNCIRLGASGGHLNHETYGLNILLSVLNVMAVPYGIWTAYSLCMGSQESEDGEPMQSNEEPVQASKPPLTYRTDASLHWKKLDWLLMLGVTVVYTVVALCNLGSTKAPQNPWKSTTYDEQVIIDLGAEYQDFNMLYFAQVSYDDFSVAVSEDGETWSREHWAEMAQGQCFRWKYVTAYSMDGESRKYNTAQKVPFTGRYVRLTAHQVGLILNEVIFRDANGNLIPAVIIDRIGANSSSPLYTDPDALLDEQETLEGEPSWYNSTYFDEIYHARTAFEHMNGTTPYETTHPPLGKVLMSWCVALFGMTPFGWRFAGAMMGVLMLPVMYLLGKQLTKRTDLAFAAMLLMTLDCMHLTQTRIATIDSFPVLFIMASYLFMLRFMQRDIVQEDLKKLLPDLALSGFFMGCAVASKWIGAYAGIGLAILFFWTCFRHVRMGCEASALLVEGSEWTDEERKILQLRSAKTLKRPLQLCCWCLLLFAAVPLMIYVLSYIPHFAYKTHDGVVDFLKSVIRAQESMLSYHATPNLGADHPFASPWYEWPLNQRPMYYANAYYVPQGYDFAIFCFGNPAVWTGGLFGFAYVLFTWIKRHYYKRANMLQLMHVDAKDRQVDFSFVLISLMAQFLPWVLVPRGTYIYHYFASVPFLCLGSVLLLKWLKQRWPKFGNVILWSYLLICLTLFIAYYPYASGILVRNEWLDFMQKFLRIYH